MQIPGRFVCGKLNDVDSKVLFVLERRWDLSPRRQSVREIEPEAYRAHLKQGCTSRPGISFNPMSSGDAVTSPVRECNTESTPMYVVSFISDICGRLKQRNLPGPSMQSFSRCFDSGAPCLVQLEGSKAPWPSVDEM